ncbi:exosome complex exonuclease Rrp41 [Candidatus Woesearchaeota archaeon]|jgi:exosome complex component RRP41|nr:exosome complex exonuclease Rrp41 [Candidatus Woesearchaeota archaeon]|tara:strand:- start:2857 stop:3561 length:705 start_codon:yes stop_codon:yes gene_type:complete
MTYKKRFDGRKFDETREIETKVGVIKKADGSAFFRIGKTIAYAAVYGPRELFPRSKQNPKKGVLRCNYNMMPFSGSGDRVRPGRNRRAGEISMVTEKSLLPVVDLSGCPNAVVDVFIELPQTDAGSRCAGICAASMALADAGLTMKDMVAAVSAGRVDDKIVIDLDYKEESYEGGHVADIPIAMVPSTEEITLLQMDGRITRDELKKAITMAKKSLKEIAEKQRKALKDKYRGK